MKILNATMKSNVPYKKVRGEILFECELNYIIKMVGIGSVVAIPKKDIEKVEISNPLQTPHHIFYSEKII